MAHLLEHLGNSAAPGGFFSSFFFVSYWDRKQKDTNLTQNHGHSDFRSVYRVHWISRAPLSWGRNRKTQRLAVLGGKPKKTEEEREEMEKVAVGQHTAREISMDAAVAVLLSAVNGWHFRI